MKKRISLIQLHTIIGDVSHNTERALTLMEQSLHDEPDIIVLPETWNTGFLTTPDLPYLADPDGSTTKRLLGDFARTYKVNIVGGSVATRHNDSIFNTTYIYDRTGTLISEYSKVHAFTPAKEDLIFTQGHSVHHFTLDNISCSSAICYDVRFPEFIRTAVLSNTVPVDLFFLPAQWPITRLKHWINLTTARAIENQMFFAAVNGCGRIGNLPMAGNSLLLDPWGEELLHLGESEEIQTATIDLQIIQDIREKINVFKDRKANLYKI